MCATTIWMPPYINQQVEINYEVKILDLHFERMLLLTTSVCTDRYQYRNMEKRNVLQKHGKSKCT